MWNEEFDDNVNEIGLDIETGEFIDAGDMEDDCKYYGVGFMTLDSCTDYMRDVCDIEYFTEYGSEITSTIKRQQTDPIELDVKNLASALGWEKPTFGDFIVVLDYRSYRDEWTGEYDEFVEYVGVLGIDCQIVEIKKDE